MAIAKVAILDEKIVRVGSNIIVTRIEVTVVDVKWVAMHIDCIGVVARMVGARTWGVEDGNVAELRVVAVKLQNVIWAVNEGHILDKDVVARFKFQLFRARLINVLPPFLALPINKAAAANGQARSLIRHDGVTDLTGGRGNKWWV